MATLRAAPASLSSRLRIARHAVAALATLALAGCPLHRSSTLSVSSSASASSSRAGSSGSSRAATSDPPSSGIHGAIVRSQLEALHGMTPDQAKAQLLKYGHDGKVSLGVVTDYGGGQTFQQACGVNKVCETSGGPGISLHDDITLYLNPVLTIAPPP